MWSWVLIVPWLPPVAGDFVTPRLVLQARDSVPSKIPLVQGIGVGLVCV